MYINGFAVAVQQADARPTELRHTLERVGRNLININIATSTSIHQNDQADQFEKEKTHVSVGELVPPQKDLNRIGK
jgi:hypothetical protein